jgi:hypothetical protein
MLDCQKEDSSWQRSLEKITYNCSSCWFLDLKKGGMYVCVLLLLVAELVGGVPDENSSMQLHVVAMMAV